ncbi:helix-turn-helix domain-containing protein [Candidatus Weimeria sp. HCP3S3_B5]|uniref:helix-turn-helix domain-containing protein n=1 Tax=Candidatus Weimeria sp. HCP3S3_B5 TaxID=3438871 RepID=UPI003F8B0BDE
MLDTHATWSGNLRKEYKMISRTELCKECGMTRRALEHYATDEGYHLLDPLVTDASGSYYDDDAVEKLNSIKCLKGYGFSLKEIKRFQTSDVQEQHEMMRALLVRVEKKQDDIIRQRKMIEDYLISFENRRK